MRRTIGKNGGGGGRQRSQTVVDEGQPDEADELPDSWQMSFEWIHRQLGRVLELFIVLQFVAGAVLFFWGIFLLLWGVVPATSLRSASYMLLAFYFIGRASLGLFGYYTDHFCVIFMYGVLMVATFVTRTIMILVRLKIATGPAGEVEVPPLLYAAPGAVPIPIEMICAVLELSQAICSFYMCFIIAKSQEFRTKLKQQDDLNRVLLTATRHIEDYVDKMMDKLEQQQKKKKMTTKGEQGEQAAEKSPSITEAVQNYQSSNKEADGNNNNNNNTGPRKATLPLKGILHQPSNYETLTRQPCQEYQQHQHYQQQQQQREQFDPYGYNRRRSQSLALYGNHSELFFPNKQQQHVPELKQVAEVLDDRLNPANFDGGQQQQNRLNYGNVGYLQQQQHRPEVGVVVDDDDEERWVGDSDEYEVIDYSDPATYMPKATNTKPQPNHLGVPQSRNFMNFSPMMPAATSLYEPTTQNEQAMNNARALSPTPQPELNFATHRSPLLMRNHCGDNMGDAVDDHEHHHHQHYGSTAPVYVDPKLVNYAHYRRQQQQQQRRGPDIEGR